MQIFEKNRVFFILLFFSCAYIFLRAFNIVLMNQIFVYIGHTAIAATLFFIFYKKNINFTVKILIGLFLGIFLSFILGKELSYYLIFGKIFINLLRMVVIPIVFASLFLGISSIHDLKKFGKLGISTFIFYTITTTIAITLGITLANIIKPGIGISIQTTGAVDLADITNKVQTLSVKDTFLSIFTPNIFKAFYSGNMLAIIFIAIFFGTANLKLKGEERNFLNNFFTAINNLIVKAIEYIIYHAPFAVFALSINIGLNSGLNTFISLSKYVLTLILGFSLQILLTYSLFLYFMARKNIFKILKEVFPVLLMAFSTSSSSATLPYTIKTGIEKLGIKKYIASFTFPLGATINMDGTALYQGVAAIFIAQAYNIELSLSSQITIVVMAILASIGTPGIPAVGIIMLTLILQSVGIPVEGIALIIGLDRILDMIRTSLNVTGDIVCSLVIDNKFDT